MSSEGRLYTFSPETKAALRKFRLGTSRAKDPQAVIYQIDKKSLEIKRTDDNDGETLTSLDDVADALPENSPRFVLLSIPLTMPNGRTSVPYILLSYLPSTCNAEQRMLYAGAREVLRREAEAGRVVKVDEAEGLEERVRGVLVGGGE